MRGPTVRLPLPAMTVLVVLGLATLLGACSSGQTDEIDGPTGPDARSLGAALSTILDDRIAEQVDAGLPEGPLGRPVEDCPVLDRAGLDALGAVLQIGADEVEVLSAAITTPSTVAGVTCALRVSDASAGAVVVGVVPTDDEPDAVISSLLAADFEDGGVAVADGLADRNVFILDSTRFDASRAVWTDVGVVVSVTGNADVVEEGQLLELLAVAVGEVERVLG